MIAKKLDALASLPMHMPGHKRNADAFAWLAGLCERDVTEIEGLDDLNEPAGDFLAMERKAASLWGAGETVALVGGSSLGVLASVLSVLGDGKELLLCRASHRSVYHAAELARARTRYLVPPVDPVLGIPLSVTPEAVAAALDACPDVGLVCVTSPTYEGVISDIRAIAGVCHARAVPLLVDEAHGAHLGFGSFPGSAVAAGADLVVQSLHKTLPSLTQTALLHINPGFVDPAKVRRTVGMLQTSSPSYLLSASIEGCVEFMEREGEDAAGRWLELLKTFRAGAGALRNIRLYDGGEGVFALDPSKILLFGEEDLAWRLRREHAIEPEYTRGPLTLCMTGLGDTRESMDRLLTALLALDRTAKPPKTAPFPAPALPEQVLPLHKAMDVPVKLLPAREALGRVSGEYAWAYPPGVPCLVPGERVDEGVLETLSHAGELHFTYKHGPESIFCVDLPGKMV